MVRGTYELNLRTQRYLLITLFTLNRDMFVGGTYTSYLYDPIGKCTEVYQAICNPIKLIVSILSQMPNNHF